MKRLDTSSMDAVKLNEYVVKSREEYAQLKRNQAMNQDTNTARGKAMRRDIARALTAINTLAGKKDEEK